MGIINYDLKINQNMNNIFLNIICILLGISFFYINNNIFIKILLLGLTVYYIIRLFINYNDLIKNKKKKKEQSSFDNSYNSYYRNKYHYTTNDNKKRKNEDWYDYYNRMNEDRKQKFYDEYERLKEEYRKKQEEYYKRNGRYYNEDDYKKNYYNDKQYYSNNKTNSISEKISNAFKLLKLNPSDTEKVIKSRYRELAIKWHPDKWTTDTMENQKIAERNFKKLSAAYEIIKEYKNIK